MTSSLTVSEGDISTKTKTYYRMTTDWRYTAFEDDISYMVASSTISPYDSFEAYNGATTLGRLNAYPEKSGSGFESDIFACEFIHGPTNCTDLAMKAITDPENNFPMFYEITCDDVNGDDC